MKLTTVTTNPRIGYMLMYVSSIWAVSSLGFLLPLQNLLGVSPRSASGIIGIFTSPWVHAGFGHLISNAVPLLVLGWACMFPNKEGFWYALAGGTLGGGISAWLLGGYGTVHIGASGVVFGMFGFLLSRGFYSRDLISIALALLTFFWYGFSMVIGILPVQPGVSWQAHFGGVLGGIVAARVMVSARRLQAT